MRILSLAFIFLTTVLVVFSAAGDLHAQCAGRNISLTPDESCTITGDISSNQNFNFTGGQITFEDDFEIRGGGTLTCTEGTMVFRGNFDMGGSSTFNMGSCTIEFRGDLVRTGGGPSGININAENSTVVFGGNTEINHNSGSNIVLNNVIVENGSEVVSNVNVTVLNNMTVEGSGQFSNEQNTTLNVIGNVNGDPQIFGDAPFIITIEILNSTTISVLFSRSLNGGPAGTVANYKVRNTLGGSFADAGTNIASATWSAAQPETVVIDLGFPIVDDTPYYLWVQNLTESESGNNTIISSPHRKLFINNVVTSTSFFSRESNIWDNNSSWSLGSPNGPLAIRAPGLPGDDVVIGNNHTITVSSAITLAPIASVTVNATGTLRVNNSGNLILADKTITGGGEFLLESGGQISIGSTGGIAQSGATGNIQTASRSFSTGAGYTYNGNSAQITGTGLPSSVESLTINNPNGVQLTSNTQVTGTLALDQGNFIIDSDHSLVATSINYTGGQFEARRFISTPSDGVTPGGWRLLSSPIATNYDNFLSGMTTQGFTGSSLGNSFFNSALDSTLANMPNVFWYNETITGTDNQRWRTLTDAANNIAAGRGYFAYIFGNITSDPRYNQTDVTLNVTGQENTGTSGTVTLPVTYTASGDVGWNLVGNPFLAAIDWDEASGWTRTNMANTIYVWDETIGQFRFWNGSTGTLNDPFNEDDATGSGIIMPFQGFWVKAESENPQLSVNQNAKTTGQGTFYRNIRQHDEIELVFEMNELSARTFVMFSEDGRSGMDRKDAYRLQSLSTTHLDAYTINRDGERLAINNLPSRFSRTLDIPLNIDGMKNNGPLSGEVIVRLGNGTRIPAHWDVELIDNQNGGAVTLSGSSINTHAYHVQTSGTLRKGIYGTPDAFHQPEIQPILMRSNPNQARFTLRITPNEASPEIPADFSLAQNFPNPFNPATTIQYNIAEDGPVRIDVFDVTGRRVATLVNEYHQVGRYDIQFDARHLSSGVYIYKMITLEGSFTQKMTLIK